MSKIRRPATVLAPKNRLVEKDDNEKTGLKRKVETSSSEPKFNNAREIAKKRKTTTKENKPPVPTFSSRSRSRTARPTTVRNRSKPAASRLNPSSRGISKSKPRSTSRVKADRRATTIPKATRTPKSRASSVPKDDHDAVIEKLSDLEVENKRLEGDLLQKIETQSLSDDLLKKKCDEYDQMRRTATAYKRKFLDEKETAEKLLKEKDEVTSSLSKKERTFDEMLSDKELEIRKLKSKLAASEGEVDTYQSEIAQLKKKEQKLKFEHEDALDTLEMTHKRSLKSKDTKIEMLHEEVENLTKKNKVLSANLRDRESEISTLNETVSALTSKISTVTAQLNSTKLLLSNSEDETKRQMGIVQARDATIEERDAEVSALKEEVNRLEMKARKDEQTRKELHNAVQELKGNIRVYCRVRPSDRELGRTSSCSRNSEEKEHQTFEYVDGSDDREMSAMGPAVRSVSGDEVPSKKWRFSYDRIFRPSETQADVFSEISQLVQSALDGYKVCIFAYGQTSSGKTYTMEGPTNCTEETLGMIPRSVAKIFEHIEKLKEKGWKYRCKVMFLEIYNENLRDLLAKKSSSSGKLEIHHSRENVTTVTGLEYVSVSNPSQIVPLLQKANANRSIGRTDMNERSSRSHSVFQLSLTGTNEHTSEKTEGILNLIDLAGSERLKSSHSTGDRLKEAQAINKSLSCLGDVISSLNNREKHVPYRNSKLTYLLKNCFGGDSKTLMFVNLSPDAQNFQESLCSLRFASKVNACQIGTARRNVKF